ncbi:LysR family transcriptional regulator [Acetobacteraceae bacterium H6797]|nr:LysR family transcriptional regulator [Acetobacteraceae bacterium H6797]
MNLRFLETFLWVARLQSFSATAERLNTTQAAISNRIAALEKELGIRLFDRDLRSVRLTAEGRNALAKAEQIVRLTQEFRGKVSSPEMLRGRISIATIDSVVHAWFPAFIRRIRATYPAVELDLTVDNSVNIALQFQQSQLDLALIMGPVIAPQVENLLLGSLPCSWYASPELDLPAGPLSIRDLARHPILAFSRGSQPHQTVMQQLAAAGVEGATVYNLNSIATMTTLAADGLGVTALPDIAVSPQGLLRRLEVREPFPALDLHAVYVSNPRHVLASTLALMALDVARERLGLPDAA